VFTDDILLKEKFDFQMMKTEESWNRSDGSGFSPVHHDKLLLVPKNLFSDKRTYPLFLIRANTSNVGSTN